MIFFRFLSRLPFQILYGIADVLYFLLLYVVRYRRRVVEENLRASFPEWSDKQRKTVVRGFYRNLTDLLVETIKLPSLTPKELTRRVVYKNTALVGGYFAEGRSVIGLASHQANWEWLPPAATLIGLQTDSVYKPLTNQFFEELMREIRSTGGAWPIPMSRLTREMVARRKLPRIIALVADQVPDKPEFAHWIPFLNQETPFYPGSEKLARSQQMPLVYVEMVRLRRGYYEATFHLIAEPPYDHLPPGTLLERYRDQLEASIRRSPANWLWSHKRWKHSRERYAGMGQERW